MRRRLLLVVFSRHPDRRWCGGVDDSKCGGGEVGSVDTASESASFRQEPKLSKAAGNGALKLQTASGGPWVLLVHMCSGSKEKAHSGQLSKNRTETVLGTEREGRDCDATTSRVGWR